ncbi:MAG TPA: 30S ribosomal protein S6 [Ktedonobacteraceae bacterium]|nr:30S ribosomal protein S6 [Ktedonobacteraceae bacterium]
MKRDYELGFILNPEVNEEQTGAVLTRISQVVSNHDGQIVRVNQWGRRRMAYPIDHHRDGHYIFMDMILTPETVAELDRTLKVTEDVLRHMVVRRDPKAAQKEREEIEARAAAQEQAASAPPEAETPQESEDSLPVELTPEEIEYVPPAIEEEESVEA